jgi:hypothetical protein
MGVPVAFVFGQRGKKFNVKYPDSGRHETVKDLTFVVRLTEKVYLY